MATAADGVLAVRDGSWRGGPHADGPRTPTRSSPATFEDGLGATNSDAVPYAIWVCADRAHAERLKSDETTH